MTPRRGYADGPFGQIHFQDTGHGDQALVLCPQSPMTSKQFDRVYGPLAEKGIRAIGIDTPGFGMSDPPDFVPTIDDYAKAIPAVLDHVGLASASAGGHHTGCKISMSAAIQFPDRVDSVVLSGPAPMSREQQQEFIDTVLQEEKNFTHQSDGSHLTKLYQKRYPWVENLEDGAELRLEPVRGQEIEQALHGSLIDRSALAPCGTECLRPRGPRGSAPRLGASAWRRFGRWAAPGERGPEDSAQRGPISSIRLPSGSGTSASSVPSGPWPGRGVGPSARGSTPMAASRARIGSRCVT